MSDTVDQPKTSLVWLDDSTNAPEENEKIRKQFNDYDNQFRMFTSEGAFMEYLESQPADARFNLIISGKLGEKLSPTIQESPKILVIYVYCFNKEYHEKWAKNFSKINGVFTDFNTLKQTIIPSQSANRSIIRNVSTDYTPDADQRETTRSPVTLALANYELDSSYMLSSTCFDCIARMTILPEDKADLVAFCQEAFAGSSELPTVIQAIQENYSANDVILWLESNSIFFKMINGTFPAAYVEGIFKLRVLIHDVLRKLEQNKSPTTIHAYKKLWMRNEQIEQWKSQKGKIIAMKEFCVANTSRSAALTSDNKVELSSNLKSVLLDIEANPRTEGVKSFALRNALVNNDDTDEVWFTIGSLFKIGEIHNEQDGVTTISMALCAPDPAIKIQALFDEAKNRFLDSNGQIDASRFGQLLVHLGSSLRDAVVLKSAEKIVRDHPEAVPQTHANHLVNYDLSAETALREQNLADSLDWYKKSLEMRKSMNHPDDSNLTEVCRNLAKAHLDKKEYTLALKYFEHLSVLIKQARGDDHPSLIDCYFELASIHEKEERSPQALSYYYKILSIMELHSFISNESYASVYNNLGNVNVSLERYEVALGFYQGSLKIKLASGTSDQQCAAVTYQNIGVVYACMGNVREARENFEKAAAIYRQSSSPNDAAIRNIQELIESLEEES